MSQYIKEHLTEEVILGQLMEECAELIKAASKVIRERQGINRPHVERPVIENLEEEIADVMLCISLMSCVDEDRIESWTIAKENRWERRLKEEKQC